MRGVLRFCVGVAIHVAPRLWLVWPDEQLKALQKPVVARAHLACGVVHIARQGSGLDSAEQGQAHRRDVKRAAPDAIHLVWASPTKAFKKERAVSLVSGLVEVAKPAD